MIDDDLDAEMEQLYRERGINPELTLLDVRTGKTATYSRWSSAAKRFLAFGWIETTPSNPEFVEKWHAELRDQVVAEWKEAESKRGRNYHDHEQPWPIFADYETWCDENGIPPLPADEATVVRWMLTRSAEGRMNECQSSLYAGVIQSFHCLTQHPPTHLAMEVRKSYHRALDFAARCLREERHAVHDLKRLSPAKALEMFPQGVVPRRFEDVAA